MPPRKARPASPRPSAKPAAAPRRGGKPAPAASQQAFGAHVSTAGGLHNAFPEAVRIGCDCLQIFVKNQRQWAAKPLTDEQIRLYQAAEKQVGLGPVFAHASYLLNLASPDEAIRAKSVAALVDELTRCEALGIAGLVIHPGAHLGAGIEAGIQQAGRSLDEAHAQTRGFKCPILLEGTAGQGSTLGHTMEQLTALLNAAKDPGRLGICLDTCHLFVAGYDLRDAAACAALIDQAETLFGLDRIRCIHTNDSKGDCGSHLDRHDHIAQGKIGRAGFANFLNDPRLAAVPRLLETPKETDDRGREWDVLNLAMLRKLVAP